MSFVQKIEYATSTKHRGPHATRMYNLMARSMYINTVLAGFFSYMAFKGDLGTGSLVVDFLITNIFLTYFLLVGSRNDLRTWTKNEGLDYIKFDRKNKLHQKSKHMTNMGGWKLFGYGFVVYGIKYGIIYFGAIYLAFNVIMGVEPSATTPAHVGLILFFKLVWLTALTDETTRKGGMAGALDPETIK